MDRKTLCGALSLLVLAAGAVWAQGAYDNGDAQSTPSGQASEDVLPSPQMQQESGFSSDEATAGTGVSPTVVPGGESPATAPMNMQGATREQGGALEARVPETRSVSGEIKKINLKTGWLTLETQDGKDVRLHALPEDIKQWGLQTGQLVTAEYTMKGKMKHVTNVTPGKAMPPEEKPQGGMEPGTR